MPTGAIVRVAGLGCATTARNALPLCWMFSSSLVMSVLEKEVMRAYAAVYECVWRTNAKAIAKMALGLFGL